VDQLKDFADSRLIAGCVYCGGLDETRDHVPSRVFLDSPFPENLPVVPACWECNNSFSRDDVCCLSDRIRDCGVDRSSLHQADSRCRHAAPKPGAARSN
jgi:hypothetical protein